MHTCEPKLGLEVFYYSCRETSSTLVRMLQKDLYPAGAALLMALDDVWNANVDGLMVPISEPSTSRLREQAHKHAESISALSNSVAELPCANVHAVRTRLFPSASACARQWSYRDSASHQEVFMLQDWYIYGPLAPVAMWLLWQLRGAVRKLSVTGEGEFRYQFGTDDERDD